MIAGMDSALRQDLYQFGHSLGMMFQIRDDMLDYLAISFNSGKEKGTDFLEGKVTLPVILAYHKGCEKPFWEKHFAEEAQNTKADLNTAVSILENNQVFDSCNEIAHRYQEKALKSLNKLPKNVIWHDLKELIAYSLSRQS